MKGLAPAPGSGTRSPMRFTATTIYNEEDLQAMWAVFEWIRRGGQGGAL